ncbi:MAG: hypothetical protein HQL40_06890 [Alphaproteobacteria bacterium]|nr:hypothetical protein [Alphaproteobacteria bacterium]
MFVISGRVLSLREDGFLLSPPEGSQVVIRTLRAGRELGLKVGERVEVYGGPSVDEEGVFLSSRICRLDGTEVSSFRR